MHCVVVRGDRLDAEVVGAETILRLLKSVQLTVGGREAGVVAEVGEADSTLGAALPGEVVLGVGGVQQGVKTGVVKQSS